MICVRGVLWGVSLVCLPGRLLYCMDISWVLDLRFPLRLGAGCFGPSFFMASSWALRMFAFPVPMAAFPIWWASGESFMTLIRSILSLRALCFCFVFIPLVWCCFPVGAIFFEFFFKKVLAFFGGVFDNRRCDAGSEIWACYCGSNQGSCKKAILFVLRDQSPAGRPSGSAVAQGCLRVLGEKPAWSFGVTRPVAGEESGSCFGWVCQPGRG
jgi:hypothetical protein